MARWLLCCADCNKLFTHSETSPIGETHPSDPYLLWSGPKPDFPDSGVLIVCPTCKKPFIYQRHELVLQSS